MPPPSSSTINNIQQNAHRDSIDIRTLSFHQAALDSIAALRNQVPKHDQAAFAAATKIDTHTHLIPPWFRALAPDAAGRATPVWDASAHLAFMAERGIAHSVVSVSTPQGNAFPDEDDEGLRKQKTVALARLLNEYAAEVGRLYPQRFSWVGVVPLPYVEESVREGRYVLEELGAVGVGVLTNHEGVYVGDDLFDGFWAFLQRRAEAKGRQGREVVFIHPTDPVVRLQDGRLVGSNPCKWLYIHSTYSNDDDDDYC